MAVYTVIARQRLDNYAVVQTLTSTDIQPGQSITVASVGTGFDGVNTVLACPQYKFLGTDADTGEWLYDVLQPVENQLLYYDVGDDVEWGVLTSTGTVTWTQTCTWITNANVEEWLGIAVATANDTAFIT
jgi:hypothetical protein